MNLIMSCFEIFVFFYRKHLNFHNERLSMNLIMSCIEIFVFFYRKHIKTFILPFGALIVPQCAHHPTHTHFVCTNYTFCFIFLIEFSFFVFVSFFETSLKTKNLSFSKIHQVFCTLFCDCS